MFALSFASVNIRKNRTGNTNRKVRLNTVDLLKLACLKRVHNVSTGNTKGGSITVPLTSCLTVLESAV
jgi:hypothetical protein